MSLNAMHRSVLIFSDTQQKAEAKLNAMISKLNEDILIRKKDYVKTATKTIEARKFSQACRGYRYQDVYVDTSLKYDDETMNLIIMKLVPPHYYTNAEYDENYRWQDHIHYF